MRIQASFSWVSYRLHCRLLVHCSVIVTVRTIVQQSEASSSTTPFCMMSKGVSSSASLLYIVPGPCICDACSLIFASDPAAYYPETDRHKSYSQAYDRYSTEYDRND
ncbi:uncharacterized protein ASPGLDRAFT_895541 [Aspergillus glaucus CBS 516.65]|uniref:Uncharacterized protein n=1 Tax=Aspergillus glaucus CBS 516.65 TaxID=1160497 RepID=A0A1L9V7V5_ASPGL|nr:hypothetical protein ASPGLDRAFT_895541 [Aspergillus glaucus CBS 516.65]OJJ80008.1 hypothetical protein ASPGLDRAFT_895541 [Aspergillus glaucus CBS 516.65]